MSKPVHKSASAAQQPRWWLCLGLSGCLAFGPALVAADDALDEAVEEQAEEVVEANFDHMIEIFLADIAEKGIEDQIDADLLDSLQNRLDEKVEEEVAEQVESNFDAMLEIFVADLLEKGLEDKLEEIFEEDIESITDRYIDDEIEQVVEENVEEALEDSVEDAVEDIIEDEVEQVAEESVEDAIEDSVEESVEEAIAEVVEENLEELVVESVEESVEESIADSVEDSLEEAIASAVEERIEMQAEMVVEEAIAGTLEAGIEATVEDNIEASVGGGVEEQITARVEDRLEAALEDKLEADDVLLHTDQWLVMAEPEVFETLASEGFVFDAITELPGLGLQLAEVAAPASFDISAARQGVIDVVGKGRAQVDLNHIYTAGAPLESVDSGVSPREAIDFPEDLDEMPVKIGMIDSAVDTSHPSLNSPRIQAREFAMGKGTSPNFHGTAIASIIAASGDEYRGLAPNAQLYAASVFQNDARHGEIASTLSLVKALDWLVSEQVDVVNISLAGPPNRLLETALKRAAEKELVLLAAAGNGGPVAKPMYPAAYDSVVAVTAVNTGGQVFRLANRGEYLDLAAPGVDLLHANAGGGYTASSGTSFAVPFAATAAARLRSLMPGSDAAQALFASALDLGEPGRDPVYGYGLIRPAGP